RSDRRHLLALLHFAQRHEGFTLKAGETPLDGVARLAVVAQDFVEATFDSDGLDAGYVHRRPVPAAHQDRTALTETGEVGGRHVVVPLSTSHSRRRYRGRPTRRRCGWIGWWPNSATSVIARGASGALGAWPAGRFRPGCSRTVWAVTRWHLMPARVCRRAAHRRSPACDCRWRLPPSPVETGPGQRFATRVLSPLGQGVFAGGVCLGVQGL